MTQAEPRRTSSRIPKKTKAHKRWQSVLIVVAVFGAVVVWVSPAAAQQAIPPGAPQSVEVAPGAAKLTLSWSAPASWGSLEPLGYEIDAATSNNATPPTSTSNDWKPVANVDPDGTSWVFEGLQLGTTSQKFTVTNGTLYHLRIRAVGDRPGTNDDVPGSWVVVSGTPGGSVVVSPSSLTVPVGSRACYQVRTTTTPTSVLTVSASVPTANSSNLTVAKQNISSWHGGAGHAQNEIAAAAAFCVKGVAVTSSPVSVSHSVTSTDSLYNNAAVADVSVTVTAADTKPTIRFRHSEVRAVEGDTSATVNNVHDLWTRRVTVELDIAPAPSSDGRVLLIVPSRQCVDSDSVSAHTQPCLAVNSTVQPNVDYVEPSLAARYVHYTAGSNDMSFTFEVRSDNLRESAEEGVQLYAVRRMVHRISHTRPASLAGSTTVVLVDNRDVCMGACGGQASEQTSMIFRIIDDDLVDGVACGYCHSSETYPLGTGRQDVGSAPPEGPPGQQEQQQAAEEEGGHAELIARMYEWRNDPQWAAHKSHTDRWDRALLAFGETVADASLTAMTQAEAQAFADTAWGERWVPVAQALADIETRQQQPRQDQQDPPPAQEQQQQQEPEREQGQDPPPPDDIVARYDANSDGRIDKSEWRQAVNDFSAGAITYSEMLQVLKAYQTPA